MRQSAVLLGVLGAVAAMAATAGGADAAGTVRLGADLDGYQLHDGVQFAGGTMSDRVPRSRECANRRRDHDKQRQCQHELSAELFDATDFLSDNLRAEFAVAVIGQLNSAIDSTIVSMAFSAAASPMAIASAARWKSRKPMPAMRGVM